MIYIKKIVNTRYKAAKLTHNQEYDVNLQKIIKKGKDITLTKEQQERTSKQKTDFLSDLTENKGNYRFGKTNTSIYESIPKGTFDVIEPNIEIERIIKKGDKK